MHSPCLPKHITPEFSGRAPRPLYEHFMVHGRSNDGLDPGTCLPRCTY
jgi:hypothetical protein